MYSKLDIIGHYKNSIIDIITEDGQKMYQRDVILTFNNLCHIKMVNAS